MTTNVLDRRKKTLTSDSRWSSDHGNWVAYVDDTGYDKMVFTDKAGFVFAGDAGPIESWKQYVSGGMKKGTRPTLPKPEEWIPGNRISVIQVFLGSDRYFQSHPMLTSSLGALVGAVYSGTGAPFARKCWEVGRCAKKAVVSAAIDDVRSGGQVVYLNYFDSAKLDTNVTNTATVISVYDQLKNRGYLMNELHPKAKPVLLKDAANDPNNLAAQAFAKTVLSGSTLLTAPFAHMDQPWTIEKLEEFDAVLSELEVD